MPREFLGESLIFIISQPRAGSTLLQRILAGHPLVQTSAEPWLMLHPVYALRETGIEAEYSPWHEAYYALQDFLVSYVDGDETYYQAIRAFAGVLYGRALQGKRRKYFLDKTPRYHLIIPELYRLFPKAKFIFLIRNPLAVLSSVLSTWVKGNWPVLAPFRSDLLLAPTRILEGIDLLGDEAIVVHYEDLVAAPAESVSSICRCLEISFSEEMLHYGDKPAPKGRFGDSTGIHENRAPTADSLDKWIQLTEREQTRHFALAYLDALGPEVMQKLGYSFQEHKGIIERVAAAPSAALVPWDLALRPSESWTRRERLIVERALAVQRHGTMRGTVSFVRGNARAIVRSLLPV